jgi:hypothetical protein
MKEPSGITSIKSKLTWQLWPSTAAEVLVRNTYKGEKNKFGFSPNEGTVCLTLRFLHFPFLFPRGCRIINHPMAASERCCTNYVDPWCIDSSVLTHRCLYQRVETDRRINDAGVSPQTNCRIWLTISSSVSAWCRVQCRFVDSEFTRVSTPLGGLESKRSLYV